MSENENQHPAGPTARIDWAAIHRRLGDAAAALEQRSRPAGQTARILAARAKALACEQLPGERSDQSLQVVEFRLAHERYALEASFVREVSPLREITALPATPPFVLGIINVRGQIISVVDLKKFFDLPQHGLTDLHKVIILRDAHMEFGLLADALGGVYRLALADLQPPPPTLTGIRAEYLRGVTRERCVMLDAPSILADPRLIVRDGVQI